MRTIFFAFAASVLILSGCEPQPDVDELFDQLVVETNYDPSVDFGSYATYTIATDTIGKISNIRNDDTLIVGANYSRPVVNAIVSNLNARGYTRVARNESPDLAINVFILKNLDVRQSIDYYGYGGYPGYFYPSYYGYGSYYYPYPYVNTYVSNTELLVIEIIDLKNVINNHVRAVWNAYLGDVYSAVQPREQSVSAIDQAFRQSPYILNDAL